jgi:hypothetical protein
VRPIYESLAAVGSTPWVPINRLQWGFGAAVAVTLSSGASLTYTVQHTFDPVDDSQARNVAASQTTTVITVTGDIGFTGGGNTHGLSVGDDVILFGTQATNMDGEYPVASFVSATSYTLTSLVSQSATGSSNTRAKSYRVWLNALGAQTVKTSTNYAFPVAAVRLNISVYTSGVATMAVLQGVGS